MAYNSTTWSSDTLSKASETSSEILNNATLSGTLAVTGATALNGGINAALTLNNTLTVGSDGEGHDVTFYGDTSTRDLIWDESQNRLRANDNTAITVGTGNDCSILHDGTETILNCVGDLTFNVASGTLKLSSNSGVAVSIGHTTSETTVNDNLTVVGDIDIGSDADGTDRTITFGHSTLKTIIGIDDSADAFVINTDAAFDGTLANNSLSIDASHNIITAGNLTIPGLFVGKTYSDTPISSYEGDMTSGSEYYMDIGLATYSLTSSGLIPGLSKFAMNDLAIKRIKVGFSNAITNLTTAELRLKKYDGSGDIEELATAVGTTWTITSSDISDNDMFYHTPSDWVIEKGEKWGITLEITVSSGTIVLKFNGNMLIENDFNDLISS